MTDAASASRLVRQVNVWLSNPVVGQWCHTLQYGAGGAHVRRVRPIRGVLGPRGD
jgi:hypothetical protein